MEKNIFENQKNIKSQKNSEKKKKINFSQKKDNTLKSLSEVELFLRDFKKFKNYIKIYKILKW